MKSVCKRYGPRGFIVDSTFNIVNCMTTEDGMLRMKKNWVSSCESSGLFQVFTTSSLYLQATQRCNVDHLHLSFEVREALPCGVLYPNWRQSRGIGACSTNLGEVNGRFGCIACFEAKFAFSVIWHGSFHFSCGVHFVFFLIEEDGCRQLADHGVLVSDGANQFHTALKRGLAITLNRSVEDVLTN